MTSAASPRQKFIESCSNIPAFYVGFLLVSFILAALTNFGASLLFLAAALTVSWVRENRRKSKHPAVSTARLHLTDILILLTGVTSAVFLDPGAGLVTRGGLGRAGFALLRGTVSITSKMFVMLRFGSTALWPSHEADRRLTVVEVFFLLSLALVVALLALAPFVVNGGAMGVLELLRSQIIPGRL